MPAPERESGEEEWEDEIERERETIVLTAEIDLREEKLWFEPRSYLVSEEKKYSGSDDGTKRRDETHPGGSLGSPSHRKERIEFLPAFFRIVVIVKFSINS